MVSFGCDVTKDGRVGDDANGGDAREHDDAHAVDGGVRRRCPADDARVDAAIDEDHGDGALEVDAARG